LFGVATRFGWVVADSLSLSIRLSIVDSSIRRFAALIHLVASTRNECSE
jgi:hypothetical protein